MPGPERLQSRLQSRLRPRARPPNRRPPAIPAVPPESSSTALSLQPALTTNELATTNGTLVEANSNPASNVFDERFVVRSVDILAFVTVDGVVLYKVSVQATEGRHWTVVRRYSDFKELEQDTWKLRGPMPPFPYAWEGLQIVLHLVEPVIQRKRRLETKRSMLEDWLRRLVARAKQTRQIQKHINRFVDVKGQFEGADSNLLANSNHVTSLVVTNPQANVETILLKLSHHADRMSTLRGKRTLNRARRGPDRSSAAQRVPADLKHLPSHVTFDLRLEVPTVHLEVSNSSEHTAKAFKVMATDPTRYFVSPAQTWVPAGGAVVVVSIFMPDGYDQSPEGGVFKDDADRFLLVSADLLPEHWLPANDDENEGAWLPNSSTSGSHKGSSGKNSSSSSGSSSEGAGSGANNNSGNNRIESRSEGDSSIDHNRSSKGGATNNNLLQSAGNEGAAASAINSNSNKRLLVESTSPLQVNWQEVWRGTLTKKKCTARFDGLPPPRLTPHQRAAALFGLAPPMSNGGSNSRAASAYRSSSSNSSSSSSSSGYSSSTGNTLSNTSSRICYGHGSGSGASHLKNDGNTNDDYASSSSSSTGPASARTISDEVTGRSSFSGFFSSSTSFGGLSGSGVRPRTRTDFGGRDSPDSNDCRGRRFPFADPGHDQPDSSSSSTGVPPDFSYRRHGDNDGSCSSSGKSSTGASRNSNGQAPRSRKSGSSDRPPVVTSSRPLFSSNSEPRPDRPRSTPLDQTRSEDALWSPTAKAAAAATSAMAAGEITAGAAAAAAANNEPPKSPENAPSDVRSKSSTVARDCSSSSSSIKSYSQSSARNSDENMSRNASPPGAASSRAGAGAAATAAAWAAVESASASGAAVDSDTSPSSVAPPAPTARVARLKAALAVGDHTSAQRIMHELSSEAMKDDVPSQQQEPSASSSSPPLLLPGGNPPLARVEPVVMDRGNSASTPPLAPLHLSSPLLAGGESKKSPPRLKPVISPLPQPSATILAPRPRHGVSPKKREGL